MNPDTFFLPLLVEELELELEPDESSDRGVINAPIA